MSLLGTYDYKIQAAELLLRIFAGILFFFQGYDKVFRIGLKGVTDTFMADASRYRIPRGLVSLLTWYTSLAELIGGLLLMAGLFTFPALCALGLDLVLVALAFSFIEPMWDMKHVFPRLLLLVALMLLYRGGQNWGLGQYFNL